MNFSASNACDPTIGARIVAEEFRCDSPLRGTEVNAAEDIIPAVGNVRMHAVTELHWQGKFRGIDFAAIPFRLEVGKTDKLKDSKGRLLWTVTAREITGTERDAAEDAGQKNKAQLLAAMAKMPGASLADLAQEVGWQTKDGKPYRSLVQRLLSALREDKLVKKESGRWVLTKAGIKAAGTVNVQEQVDIPF
jgi:hypothetical protein